MSEEAIQAILDEAQRMSLLCGENQIQRVGVWVEATQKLAVLARKYETQARIWHRSYRNALGEWESG